MWLVIFMATLGLAAAIAVSIVVYQNRKILFPKEQN